MWLLWEQHHEQDHAHRSRGRDNSRDKHRQAAPRQHQGPAEAPGRQAHHQGARCGLGRKAAEAGRSVITQIVNGADLVFVTAGLGGGTGTIAPVVAAEAKRVGALVVAIVTTPFAVERKMRMQRALEGLDLVRGAADAVLVLDNNRLLQYAPNLPLEEAFSIMDQLIAEIIKGIVETITVPSLINLDFADVRSIMRGGGLNARRERQGA